MKIKQLYHTVCNSYIHILYNNKKYTYNWPAFLAVNNGYTSSITKGHIAMHTIVFLI